MWGADELPGQNAVPDSTAMNAKVSSVDSSYRVLTVQYPNRQHETFKVGLQVNLREMEAGDSIVIRTGEVVAVRVWKS